MSAAERRLGPESVTRRSRPAPTRSCSSFPRTYTATRSWLVPSGTSQDRVGVDVRRERTDDLAGAVRLRLPTGPGPRRAAADDLGDRQRVVVGRGGRLLCAGRL